METIASYTSQRNESADLWIRLLGVSLGTLNHSTGNLTLAADHPWFDH